MPVEPLETLSVIVQLPLAGRVPPLNVTELPLVATEPLQVLDAAGVLATLSPLGILSASAAPVRE